MLALREVPSRTEDGEPLSTSSTRTSSPATEASLPREAGAESLFPGKGHKAGDVVDGRYVLIEQLGKGGMGVVWKARSTALDVEVAVKLVRSATPNPEAFKRMAREAHAAARLGHPAMATVLDFGSTPEGAPYVVMELLRGESLGEVLGRECRVDALRAVGTLLPILDGLREAHDKGIVHRDIKPENLFISKTARGRIQPKVLDFGIAKLDQPTSSNTKLTQDGAVLGSPGYFSPEQARGEADIDFRTDIWSISVVLYELITGELPFSGANYNALLMSILKDTPKSIVAHGFGDDALWRIVQRGLQRDRSKRWGSTWELGRALASWLYDQGVRADVASRSLKEVWLDARSASEHAPAPGNFGAEGTRSRRVLSTLIKRRAADTLAGETISTLIAQRRIPTRVLGWSAVAAGMGVIIWSALAQSTTGPTAHAAVAEAASVQLATPAPAAVPGGQESSALAVATAPPDSPALADTGAAAEKARLSLNPGRKSPERAAVPKSQVASRVKTVEVAPIKAQRSAQSAATHTKPGKSTPRKRIDQEFGF